MATYSRVFRLAQWAAVAVFLARSWQHIYWDAPYRALFWDEAWLKWLVEGVFGLDWRTYVTSPDTDRLIQALVTGTGIFYLLCALAAIFINRLGRPGRIVLWMGSANLILLAFLYCKEKFLFSGQFFEYTLQWSTPLFLAILAQKKSIGPGLVLWMKIAIALTFTCHGLYAVGYYPRPGQFMEMVMNILPLDEAGARQFLIGAGILDFVASVLVFWPGQAGRLALAYTIFWGLATTMARLLAYFHWNLWDSWAELWLHEVLMRLPHFLIPLGLYIHLWGGRGLRR